jgi:tight adherence protein C
MIGAALGVGALLVLAGVARVLARVAGGRSRARARARPSVIGGELPRSQVASVERPPSGRVVPMIAVLVLGAALVGGAVACASIGAFVVVARMAAVRLRRRRLGAEQDRSVPELVDLFTMAAAAGLPAASALHAVAQRAPGPLRSAVQLAAAHQRSGATLASSLELLRAHGGQRCGQLVDAVAAAARDGTPLVPALAGVAASTRDQRRRAAEEAARRLPVTLLFPLACCVLPAAVLLALVPILLVSLGSLHT